MSVYLWVSLTALGTSSYGIDVDPFLFCLCGLSYTYDTMEGQLVLLPNCEQCS